MNYLKKEPLSFETWVLRAKEHEALVSPLADAFLKRRGLGQTHAVHDFLFTYYSCSPAKLKQWIPSVEESLMLNPVIRDQYPWLTDYWFKVEGDVLCLKKELPSESIYQHVQFIADLCSNILQRPPRFGCFGLHEWAMLYKVSSSGIRHQGHRLRVSPEDLARFVESQKMSCSHYDAYRFFTKEAKPLNTLNPIFETRIQMEQGGCVHANMDLYKWAIKLWPWIGSDFLRKTFFLAVQARELDMRASPYDLKDLGYLPICIETEEGRRQYQKEQQLLAEGAVPLREKLHAFCKMLLSYRRQSQDGIVLSLDH